MSKVSPILWKTIGGIQIVAGILIWSAKIRKYIAGFMLAILIYFTLYHIIEKTSDIGGSIFMALLLAIIVWNPSALRKKIQ